MTGFSISRFKRIAQNGAKRVLRSSLGEQLKSWLRGSGPADRFGIEVRGDSPKADVIAYFGDGPDQLYQLHQWVAALEALNDSRPVLLVFRQRGAFKAAKTMTSLPSALAISYPDLAELYAENDYRLAIYVNNGMRNFQSMADTSIVHVHVDHGESDKKSSISNQLKAYDKVFVAGLAAIERCEQALWGLDRNKMVTIGRPPLDGNFDSILPHDSRRTVVYAPTWQGENESNNFTTVDTLGPQIVEALIALDVRIVYRPHPRVAAAHELAVMDADRTIRMMLHKANDRGGAHVVSTDGSIMDLFVDTDVLMTDVSSVGPDFLFLHPDKGLILTERHTGGACPELQSPMAAGLGALTAASLDRLPQMIDDALGGDALLAARRRLKGHYFSANTAGESTSLFIAAIEDSICERESERTV